MLEMMATYKTFVTQLCSKHMNYFQLIIYFDEVEICNPLGARRGVHKLGTHAVIHVCISNHSFIIAGLFYYVLGNLHPKLRSSLKTIQLIACVTNKNIKKYGFEKILEPFIDEVNRLIEVCMQYMLKRHAVPINLYCSLGGNNNHSTDSSFHKRYCIGNAGRYTSCPRYWWL